MTRLIAALALLALLSSACSDSNDGTRAAPEPAYLPITNPALSDPPDEGTFFLNANTFDLADVGYQAQEYFVSGSASSFTNVSELTVDGMWQVATAAQADYKTRIVVHRPIDDADFSSPPST